MNICKICKKTFIPNRSEQMLCGVICRQKNNGAQKAGQKTGPQMNRVYQKSINKDGYIMMYAGNHPFAEGRKMISEHVITMEIAIGRRINPTECVHHRNGIKTDNRLENLEIQIHAEHSRHHSKQLASNRKRVLGRFA